jgi:hypothetical protein
MELPEKSSFGFCFNRNSKGIPCGLPGDLRANLIID